MFQAVFRAQSDAVLVWPLIGLVIFVVVFTVKVIGIARSNDGAKHLPFEGDES